MCILYIQYTHYIYLRAAQEQPKEIEQETYLTVVYFFWFFFYRSIVFNISPCFPCSNTRTESQKYKKGKLLRNEKKAQNNVETRRKSNGKYYYWKNEKRKKRMKFVFCCCCFYFGVSWSESKWKIFFLLILCLINY